MDSLHCRVQGKLPAWLQGSFYRNGPGGCRGVRVRGEERAALRLPPPRTRAPPPPRLPGKFGGAESVIDGCAMVARFRLDGAASEAVLSHRFLDTVYHRAAQAEGAASAGLA